MKRANLAKQLIAAAGNAPPAWADRKAIAAIYAKARRMSLRTGVPHQVDHEIPLQGGTVCGLHVETNLRVITAYENQRRPRVYKT